MKKMDWFDAFSGFFAKCEINNILLNIKNALTKFGNSVKLLACHLQKVFFCCEKI